MLSAKHDNEFKILELHQVAGLAHIEKMGTLLGIGAVRTEQAASDSKGIWMDVGLPASQVASIE